MQAQQVIPFKSHASDLEYAGLIGNLEREVGILLLKIVVQSAAPCILPSNAVDSMPIVKSQQ